MASMPTITPLASTDDVTASGAPPTSGTAAQPASASAPSTQSDSTVSEVVVMAHRTTPVPGPGMIVFPTGGSSDVNSYPQIFVLGINATQQKAQKLADSQQIPVYFVPTHGTLIDAAKITAEKFFGMQDQTAQQFSEIASAADHPMVFVADSGGTVITGNAAEYFGLPENSDFIFISPAQTKATAQAEVNSNGGNLIYYQPKGYIANLYAPNSISAFLSAFNINAIHIHEENVPK